MARKRYSLVGRIASIQRHYGADDPRLEDLRRELHTAEAEDFLTKLVNTWPPLTDAQRLRLASLLMPSTSDDEPGP